MFFLVFFILFSFSATSSDPVIVNCRPTPQVNVSIPKVTNSTNNLIRKTGDAVKAKGDVIYITGRITDINCIPIQGASVFIWHKNSEGYYAINGRRIESDPLFIGSGYTVTDNLGNYNFVTIMPGSKDGNAPEINFDIQHPNFVPITTKMFFEGTNYSSDTDDVLIARKRSTETIRYNFNIALSGESKFK